MEMKEVRRRGKERIGKNVVRETSNGDIFNVQVLKGSLFESFYYYFLSNIAVSSCTS